MFDKASLKLGLDKAVLQSMNTAQGKELNNKQLTKKEIEDLLKKGKHEQYGSIPTEGSLPLHLSQVPKSFSAKTFCFLLVDVKNVC